METSLAARPNTGSPTARSAWAVVIARASATGRARTAGPQARSRARRSPRSALLRKSSAKGKHYYGVTLELRFLSLGEDLGAESIKHS